MCVPAAMRSSSADCIALNIGRFARNACALICGCRGARGAPPPLRSLSMSVAQPSAERRDRDARPARSDADLPVLEIAARVLLPGVARELERAHARVAAAHVEERALAAASLDAPRPRPVAGHPQVARLGR